MSWQEKKGTIQVPKGSGIEGFISSLRTILQLGRVQRVQIDVTGKVEVTRFVREGEEVLPEAPSFDDVLPYAIIRNSIIEEIEIPLDAPAPHALTLLFKRVADQKLTPLGLVSGFGSTFWEWHKKSCGIELLKQNEVYGLPFLFDNAIPDYTLFLCAGFTRTTPFTETHSSFKITMPERP